jgi:hypothetical protein
MTTIREERVLETAHRERAQAGPPIPLIIAPTFVDPPFLAEAQMMTLSIDRAAEDDVGHWQFRVAQLEAIVRELLMKNEQLRMPLRLGHDAGNMDAVLPGLR